MTELEVEPVNGEFTTQLPSGLMITFKLLTRSNEKQIEKEVEALQKVDNSVHGDTVTRLRYMITSVNGNRDKQIIRDVAENMIVRDVRALREEIRKVTPDVDFNMDITCQLCDTKIKARMPFGANFFWPDF
jgi:hypothetical protein